MVRQIGMPTIFFTLSAADYHWPDLFRLLQPNSNPDSLNDQERRVLMHENPAKVAWFFKERCDIFMREFMMKFFSVKDFWYRYEWQHRGSPHIHGLLWLQDAPDCSDIGSLDDALRLRVIQYFDGIVSAWINQLFDHVHQNPCRRRYSDLSAVEREDDLNKLLSLIQRHSRCGPHCMRRKRGSRRMECRFKFPIQTEEESTLRLEDGAWKFFPKRNDRFLQRYNKFITQVWRGNTDFTAITSKDAVLNYISKYASKGEHQSESYSLILRRVCNRNPVDTPAATLVRRLLISSVAERNYSAQEIQHLLMGWPLYHSSRAVIVLSLRDEWHRLGARTDNDIASRYARRDDSLESLTLFEYAKNYRHEGQRVIKRRTECIVRVIPYLKLTEDPEINAEYYRLQCKLHIPWRRNGTRPEEQREAFRVPGREGYFELGPNGPSWGELYILNQENNPPPDPFADFVPNRADDVEYEDHPLDHAQIVRDAGLAAARLQPNINPNDPIGYRPIDEAYEWPDVISENITQDQVNDYLRSLRTAPSVGTVRVNVIAFDDMSPEQQDVLHICASQMNDPQFTTKRVIVQGKAGTGKSALIKAMCQRIDQNSTAKQHQVLAPTGAAALNVDGKTIHSFLRISVGQYEPLTGENLRRFQLAFQHIKFIIIDEYSMIGLRFMTKIHKRLCEARGSADQPFGGYFIYFFGDLRQLPPVRNTAIYMTPRDDFSRFALRLVGSIQVKKVLTVCHRQGPSQSRFRAILDSIATGSVTQDHWHELLTRRIAVNPANRHEFTNAINLFPTNVKVDEHKDMMLAANQLAVAVIDAEHNNTTALHGGEQNTYGLARTLKLSIGSRIMLRRNLFVERGLVNGSIGTVRKIIYKAGERPPALPAVILIEFERFQGPFFSDRLFPLLPSTLTWREQNVDCSRKQFHISLAYALTIHKAQGLTLDKVRVDIGDKENCSGQTYVALSRVRRFEDLLLIKAFNYSRLADISKMKAVIEREKFMREEGLRGES